MYQLVSRKYEFGSYFGGIFYAINPFVYERVMAGQWQFLLGYAVFPFVISSTIDFFNNLKKKNTIVLASWIFILINLSIHFSFIFGIFVLIYAIIYIYLNFSNVVKILKNSVILVLLVIITNINWIMPTLIGKSVINQTLNYFNAADLYSFQSVQDNNFGIVFNLLSGYGFWPEVYDYFILPKNIIVIWPILSLLIISLTFLGFIRALSEKNMGSFPHILTLFIIFFISLDLAGGVALKSFSGTVLFIYDLFPPIRGFREPQKLIGIIMFCYAYFGSIGLAYLLEKAKKNTLFFVFCSLFFVLPFIYTPTVFGGFWGQLSPVFYPKSWYEVNKKLSADKDNFLSIFFPWHQYTSFRFTNNRMVTNPAVYYFNKPVITAKNYETAFLGSHDTQFESLHVDGLISIEKERVNMLGEEVEEKLSWGQSISPINVKYIILSKDEDWISYRFLDKQVDLKNIYEDDDLILYQNLKWGAEEEEPVIDNSAPDL